MAEEHQASPEYASHLDKICPLVEYRDAFFLPSEAKGAYFCGHSLGAQPKAATRAIKTILSDWQHKGTTGYFEGDHAWLTFHEQLIPALSNLVGAKGSEVTIMNALTVNIHLMMASFYKPTDKKFKILIEEQAFCSDHYAVSSQLKCHGYDEGDVLLAKPRDGKLVLETQDILNLIEQHHESLAFILLPSVQYFTGQVLDIKTIAKQAQKYNIPFGVDCAHAVGNIPLQLHDWGVDFAVWCHYKYLNAGPGSPAGVFIHEKHHGQDLNRLAGWWGHDKASRFEMGPTFKPIKGALGWQLSCPPILSLAPLKASLEIVQQAGLDKIRNKSLRLTGFLRFLLNQALPSDSIITPEPAHQSGAQLSIQLPHAQTICQNLLEDGFHCDYRHPNVIRIAPVPLYNTYSEVFSFVQRLKAE